MRLLIAGSRSFGDYELLKREIIKNYEKEEMTEIISGCAKGADSLAIKYAEEMGIRIKKFPAESPKTERFI